MKCRGTKKKLVTFISSFSNSWGIQRMGEMIAIVLAATVIVCEAGSTCIVVDHQNPTERAMEDFRLQQERIRPKETELEKAQKRFKEDQERLRCANHPDQC
jgi:hypothetical protein